jgi:flagellar biosynthesis/type III secretory pathway protein FliH
VTLSPARVIRASEAKAEVLVPAHSPTERRARIIRRERLQAEEQAASILGRAQQQAEHTRQQAEEASVRIRAEAEQQGYREGLARAAHEAVERIALEHKHDTDHGKRLVQLARLLAERIVGRALAQDEALLQQMALTLLEEVRGARRITFRCSPEAVAALEQAVRSFGTHAEIRVEAEPALGPGDFELRTDVGTLEGSLGARLDLLANKLAEGLKA